MTTDSPRSVARSAVHFLTGTLLSRFSGLGRDVAMAFCFGTNPAIAAFMVAFRFASLLRRLLGEGSLSSGFIPHYESLKSQDPKKGAEFFRDFFASMGLLAIGCVLVIETVLFIAIRQQWFGPDAVQIVRLTLLMLPGVVFICWFALSTALLQCEKKFFLTGVAPIAFNLLWIAAALHFRNWTAAEAVVPLSVAVVLGFLAQWLMTVRPSWNYLRQYLSWKELNARWFSEDFRKVLKPLLLSIVGVGAVQINSAMDGVFARFASLEGPAYLWYAIRLEQLPVALFGVALSSALLPSLSRAMDTGQLQQFSELVHFAIKRSFSLIFPCAVGILVWGAPAIHLVYGRGGFSDAAVVQTTMCLWAYAAGLVPTLFVMVLAPALYARKDFRTPTLFSALSVLLNLLLNAFMVFAFGWGAFSIAVATSLCAFFNCTLLCVYLSKQIGPVMNESILRSGFKTALASIAAGASTLFFTQTYLQDITLPILLGHSIHLTHKFVLQLMNFGIPFLFFAAAVYVFARLFKAHDLLELTKIKG